jgi:uncharacterized protein DUF6084
MPEIGCRVESIGTVAHAAVPSLRFRIEVVNLAPHQPVAGIDLRCQVLIETPRRTYSTLERYRVVELFGEASRPVRDLLWTHASVNVPAFDEMSIVDLDVPCTFDFDVAVAKYFGALEGGDVPLCLQFSGTVFYTDAHGRLQISRIAWSSEARCALPLAVWKELRERYYPGTTWLCLSRDSFERLCDYRRSAGLPSWEHALDRLLAAAGEPKGVAEDAR